jgi:zinc D-Ala-D-Ala carboxypeptidase
MKLTDHFTLEELVRSQTAARLDIANSPDGYIQINLQRLAETLENVRTAVGNRSIQVTSGYRSKALNEINGGSKTSAHMDGRAADIVVRGMTALQVARAIQASGIVLDQLIYEFGQWVHVGIHRVGEVARGDVLTARRENGRTVYHRGIVASD